MALEWGFCLGEDTTSKQFSDVFLALIGDGITRDGMQMAVTINGFEATVGTGRAMAAGRWLWNDSPRVLAIHAAGSKNDRTDAIAVRVDDTERKVTLEVAAGIDYAAIKENPVLIRNDEEYLLLLYLIRIRRGASALGPEDITDLRPNPSLCGLITPLSEVSAGALKAYNFITAGMDQEVDRILHVGDELISRAEAEISDLMEVIRDRHAAPDSGELMFSYVWPTPKTEWVFYAHAVPEKHDVYQYVYQEPFVVGRGAVGKGVI